MTEKCPGTENMELEKIKEEYDRLTKKLGDPEVISQWEKFQELSKRKSSLEKIFQKAQDLETLKQKTKQNKQIISSREYPELVALAEQELQSLKTQEEELLQELGRLQKEDSGDSSANEPGAIIMEIRAGTGGEEAALFARNLFDMYSKYADTEGWKQTVLDIHETDLNGIREASFVLEGEGVFEKLQHEGGVHRVQRIPTTEKSGRIHTSTASIAVLTKPKKTQVQINPADLQVDIFNASGPGGQNVNKRKTAVRITHKPTGIVASSQSSRNQQQNRAFAMVQLEARLLAKQQKAEEQKTSGERKSQIGGAMRAEKIRTYNFPQDRITDHRTKQNWHGLEKILQGNLNPLLTELGSSLLKRTD